MVNLGMNLINAYLDEKINLGKAAELLGVHRLELQNELREKGVPIRGLSKENAIPILSFTSYFHFWRFSSFPHRPSWTRTTNQTASQGHFLLAFRSPFDKWDYQ
jgi:hypothetical protein